MRRTIRLKDLLPDYYDDVVEVGMLLTVEQYLIDELTDTLTVAQNNLFVMLADSDGLKIWETVFEIDSSDQDIEQRRMTLIFKLMPPKPITLKYLREIIDLLDLQASITVTGYTASIVSSSDNPYATQMLNELLYKYLPANLYFVPRVVTTTTNTGDLRIGTSKAIGVTQQNKGGLNGE